MAGHRQIDRLIWFCGDPQGTIGAHPSQGAFPVAQCQTGCAGWSRPSPSAACTPRRRCSECPSRRCLGLCAPLCRGSCHLLRTPPAHAHASLPTERLQPVCMPGRQCNQGGTVLLMDAHSKFCLLHLSKNNTEMGCHQKRVSSLLFSSSMQAHVRTCVMPPFWPCST